MKVEYVKKTTTVQVFTAPEALASYVLPYPLCSDWRRVYNEGLTELFLWGRAILVSGVLEE